MRDITLQDSARGGFDVVIAGHILNERVVFPDRILYPVLGSPTAYASVCLAKLGAKVGIVTRIGGDFPRNLLDAFSDVGVDTAGVKVGNVSTKDNLIYYPDGRKSLRYTSRAPDVQYEDFPAEYLKAAIIYICPMDHEVGIETINRIAALGQSLVVDLGGFGGATTGEHPAVKDGHELQMLCPHFGVVKASIEDLEYILGATRGDEEQVAKQLLEWGARIAVITLGSEGAYVRMKDKSARFPAYLTDSAGVVDQTGAGDCFSAGFLFDYRMTHDPFSAAVFGNAVTSYVIERSGGVAAARMPTREEAQRRAENLRGRLVPSE